MFLKMKLFFSWDFTGSIKHFSFRLGISCLEAFRWKLGHLPGTPKPNSFKWMLQGDFQPFPFIRRIAKHLPSLHLGLEDDFSFEHCLLTNVHPMCRFGT